MAEFPVLFDEIDVRVEKMGFPYLKFNLDKYF